MKKLKSIFLMLICVFCAACTTFFFACDTAGGLLDDANDTPTSDTSGDGGSTQDSGSTQDGGSTQGSGSAQGSDTYGGDSSDSSSGTSSSGESYPATHTHTYRITELTWFGYDSVMVVYTCSECGDTQTITPTVTSETTPATCTDYGKIIYVVKISEEESPSGEEMIQTNEEKIAATGHTHSEVVIENEVTATCTGNGSYDSVIYCSTCGEELSRVTTTIPAGHIWNSGEITTEATCTKAGVKTYTCTACGETYTETIPATGHTHSEAVVENEVAATCTGNGSYDSVVYCSDCGEELSRVTTTIPATGHKWDDGEVITAPTCTEEGEKICTCSVCGETETVVIAATGHTESEAVIENEVAATCTEDGSYDTVIYCTICGEEISRVTTTIPATGHIWDNGEVTTAPTCTEEGAKTYTCTTCGETKTEVIAATCHTWSDTYESDENGHWHVCTVCGEETEAETHALDDDNICTACGYVKLMDSTGLEYTLSSDETYYIVSGIGECTDTYIIIPSTYNGLFVTEIAASAFNGNETIVSVYIPESITSIGSEAFYDCTLLESITIGSGVTSIGTYAFYNCAALESITIPESVTSIGSYAFYGCASLTSIIIPDGVTSIGGNMFYGCASLESIIIPDGVTFIGGNAFYGCSSLTSITIPDSVTSIGNYAFSGCVSLTSVYFKGTASQWAYITFDGQTSNPMCCVGGSLYLNEELATDITIENITTIKMYSFYKCTSLTSVTIGESIRSVRKYAFYGCTSLDSVVISNNVTKIYDSAFSDCTALTSVTIGEGVTSIANYAFNNCTALTEINFNAVAMEDLSDFNFIFYKAGQSGEGITLTIGANVTTIPAYMFGSTENYLYASKIVTVIFEENSSCAAIGSYTFSCCYWITDLNIPSSVTSIGLGAFSACHSLVSISLPFVGSSLTDASYTNFSYIFGATSYNQNSSYVPSTIKTVTITTATSIPSYAFYGCSYITEVIISESVTSIGAYAFYGCSSMTSITIEYTTYVEYGWYFMNGSTQVAISLVNPETVVTYLVSRSDVYVFTIHKF